MTQKATFLMALSLTVMSCATGTTRADRMATVTPMFFEQLDDVEQRLASVQGKYQTSGISPDASFILDHISAEISSSIIEARFAVTRAQQELDSNLLRQAGEAITMLHVKTSDLQYMAQDAANHVK